MTTPSDGPGFDQYISDPVAHFESIPWCAALMKDKSIVGNMVPTRTPVASTESSLVNTTLNSGSTIRACATWLRLVKKPEIDKKKPILEIFALVDLGEGMNGYAKTLHGGFAGVLLDEVMSVSANQAAENGAYTRSMTVTYHKPIRTPAIIVCRALVVSRDGRKVQVKGYLEDSKGTVLTEADALWIGMKFNVREMSKL